MILRKILGVAIGIVLANLAIYGLEWLWVAAGWVGVGDLGYFDEEYVLRYGTLSAQVLVILAWALGTAVGAFAAFAIGRSDWTGWVIAAWVAALTAYGTLGEHPGPTWVAISAVAVPFIAAVLAFGLYRRWRAARLHLR